MFRCLPTGLSTSICIYTGIPLFQTSEMWTSHFNWHFAPVWIAIPLTATHYNSWNADTMLLRKVDGFFGPFSTWTVQNLLDNLEVHLPPMQGCLPPLIASTTEHYNSTGTHSTNLWSAFLTIKCTARESSRLCLYSTRQHGYALPHLPKKYTRSLRNMDASIIRTHSSHMVSAIEGFHCNICLHTHWVHEQVSLQEMLD